MPKVLVFDIETAPMLSYVWGLWDQNVALNQIENDWYVLSWAAKWLNDPPAKMMYADQRNATTVENDKVILKQIWHLLNKADIVVTQNGKKFDVKKLNARFLLHGFKPPASYRHIDTCEISKKHFAFTSNKLEYLSKTFNKKYKKITKHGKYDGFELWRACLKGDIKAWEEMKKYNIYDVLSTEEIARKLIPWDNTINFNVYNKSDDKLLCSCGAKDFSKYGYSFSNAGKYQRFKCRKCGAEMKGTKNLLSLPKKQTRRVVR